MGRPPAVLLLALALGLLAPGPAGSQTRKAPKPQEAPDPFAQAQEPQDPLQVQTSPKELAIRKVLNLYLPATKKTVGEALADPKAAARRFGEDSYVVELTSRQKTYAFLVDLKTHEVRPRNHAAHGLLLELRPPGKSRKASRQKILQRVESTPYRPEE